MNRELVMLAHKYDGERYSVAGKYMSIKLDGERCFWDGGISRGKAKRSVPWANNDKDERYREEQISTGLWSRYGNVIHAPDWWLDALPKTFLDGELYLDRGRFEETRSIVSTIIPSNEWSKIQFRVFDAPQRQFFQSGRINNPQFKKMISEDECMAFIAQSCLTFGPLRTFEQTVDYLQMLWLDAGVQHVWRPLEQVKLLASEDKAIDQMLTALNEEVLLGGEGLMIRSSSSIWLPVRNGHLLKVKAFDEGEGTIISWTLGEGKLSGMVGAYIIEWEGERFKLSGFTEDERTIGRFTIGDKLRFRYRGLTSGGLPREARYWR